MLSRSDLLTLLTINFIVVTKGAERISEVSARFTLDAMPGKQMAIDADLNAGLINQAQAQTRRKDVASEADFYGAMDGASKFVRGDAIAGMMILAINLIGGVCIGIFKYNLSADAAFQQYVLMTIGDGLVALVDKAQGNPLTQRIRGVRQVISDGNGVLLPEIRIRENFRLKPSQ
ncbi:FHIPEP family type III secretion protein, partial [Escherichia coli]|nr:FHIPEP family type III secretion protein [Escherichia coli]